jgi:hypothetical protein
MSANRPLLACALCLALAGCGSSAHTTTHNAAPPATKRPQPKQRVARKLHSFETLELPDSRSGLAASVLDGKLIVSGGLTRAGVSSDTVFELNATGDAITATSLPGAVHDAASAIVAGRLLLFGGGVSEGSDRILQVRPGPPRVLASTLPQPLSDLTATTIGADAYVAGGWNGSATNRNIYAFKPSGAISSVATVPTGVRYPAAGTVDGRLIIAGGETSSGSPTARALEFDPASGRINSLPNLPAPTDHSSGIGFDGTFYLLGGLRNGTFTDQILSWSPGQRRWHRAGHLPAAIADAAATDWGGAVALAGGRDVSGKRATVILLKPQ